MKDVLWDIAPYIISIVVIMMIAYIYAFIGNSCTSQKWNNGICPNCDIRYELRGVSKVAKYYVCDECGQEVRRY